MPLAAFPYLRNLFMKPIQDIFPQLAEPRKVVITMHQKPDADAMGSSLGLAHFLKQLGHSVTVISPTNWAKWLNWMPGVNEVIDYELHTRKSGSDTGYKQNGCFALTSIFFTVPKILQTN